ncbi:TRI65 protein, partial [Eudromia elegans]|nr:TRI65 protein [Eudromia elegans]
LSPQKLEEKLLCSICLEVFRSAVTLPCGHNFCHQCISDHWDKQEASGAEKGYSCPDCRKCFARRPELQKNVALCGVVELAGAGGRGAAGAEGRMVAAAVVPGGQCARHGRPLELYCEDEQRCVCCVCTLRQCQRHRRLLLEEAHAHKQALLRDALDRARREAERTEQAMQELEEQTQSIKDSSETLKSVVENKFGRLEKALQDCQQQTVGRIEHELAAALGQVEENWNHLKDYLDALNHHQEKAQDLLACADKRIFLEVWPWPRCPRLSLSPLLVPGHSQLCSLLQRSPASPLELLSLPRSCRVSVRPSSGVPPAPLSREPWGNAPHHRNLSFDADTANRYLRLSSTRQKAKHARSAESPCQGNGARFELWQVLCAQSYGRGHHYWEVRTSSHSVIVGVTYGGISRKQQPGHKFNIGLDGGSWGLQVREDCYLAWHKGRSEKIRERLYKNLGVSLDYDNGLLSFYGLGDRVQLIHKFHHIFTEPLFPVFWLCEGRTITLCQR